VEQKDKKENIGITIKRSNNGQEPFGVECNSKKQLPMRHFLITTRNASSASRQTRRPMTDA
jgi:hypothetical protein